MTTAAGAGRITAALRAWAEAIGLETGLVGELAGWADRLADGPETPLRSPLAAEVIRQWERRHGYDLPGDLKAWLAISDGLYRDSPLIHPLTAIGPMVPFAAVPGLIVQPESWYELGNPGGETVCIDLGYRWPEGDFPLFASGDDLEGRRPRIIAPSFRSWFLRLIREGGREYWRDEEFVHLGDPWQAHRRYVPTPPLPARLRALATRVRPLMRPDADEWQIAADLGISRSDLEALFRHLQHVPRP